MMRILTGSFGVICVTLTAMILMDAAKIAYAHMESSRASAHHPEKEVYTEEQATKLNGYTWVDKQEKGVSMPVSRAMSVIAAELASGAWAPVLPKPFSLEDLGITDGGLLVTAGDSSRVDTGRAIFAANCLGCHGAKGEGATGANLTDGYWLHGSSPTEIFTTIYTGVGPKGMPAWGGLLGEEVQDVLAFVLSLKDTNIAGKEPQGVDADGNAAP